MRSTFKMMKLKTVNLSYKEWEGEKGPLICLPSLASHKGSFDAVAERLAPEYQLYALDLRGRGDSDKPAEGYGFAYHAQDILGFADALGLETFAILGHSFGATVGVYLASIRPGRLRAIVMIDGGADPKEDVMLAMRPSLRSLDVTYASIEDYLESMKAIPYFHPWNPALEHYFREDVVTLEDGSVCSKTSKESVERDLDIHFYYSMCVHFPTMQCPSLFIRPQRGLLGDRAHILDEREAAAFVASIPNCWRVDLPDVNHYTMLLSDNPMVVPPIHAFLSTIFDSHGEARG